ncbi:glycosyltransferase family 4 protein [Methylomonas sp. SURF-2]|uniref:Glycosyltransferase family 4 protein n=1 Tax=Methylomonas subterranea TaxID=2952225 RepID=A0ABT1TJ41_9GAMM|nr:glycosyltransferase family 1 protein [Methylomonas sp. SURF-2]MCQ8105485.1 glycosyltransferase family 4 protein [Methylomonas sp. SURF-2]
MKIVFDSQIFAMQEYGGISRYAYELAVELATSTKEDVAVISPLYVNRYLACAPSDLNVIGVPVPKLPKTVLLFRAINSILAWPVTRHIRPNIFHETYYSSISMAPKSAKVVMTVYDMIHEKFSGHFPKTDPTSRRKALAVKRADHVICISEQTRQDLIELLGVNPAKTSVVNLGFSLMSQSDSVPESVARANPFLLYVGERRGYKNFEGLLQAYAMSLTLKNDFDLICFGGGEFTHREKTLLQQFGLSNENVRQVSGDDALLAGYYRSASAFVYPSLYEGFGIPPLEAMSFNCPVICSGVSSIPEVVGNAGEMFDPCDLDSMRMAVERVVSDNVLQQTLIARGQERIKLFSWHSCAQETLAVYRSIL